jgi:hypothetical protein
MSAEVKSMIPSGISSADSLIHAENYIKKWIIDKLTDVAAYKNIGDDRAEVDRLVNEYRRSLIRYRYQERLVKDKVSANIGEYDKLRYYEENKEQFTLSENLIKGLFLKVPVNAPKLDEVRKWYRAGNEDALEKIEKYSLQNAVTFDYFNDRWVRFEDYAVKMPQRFTDPARFLRINDHIEVSDSVFHYFLNISDKLLVGNIAPFDYVEPQIKNMLINRRKIDFLNKFGEELYKDAVKNGTVKFNTK